MHVRETATPAARPAATPATTADTVVFLHGLAGSATNWSDLARVLAGQVHGIAVDLPGFGWTEPPVGFRHDYRDYAEIVIRFLEQRVAEEPGNSGHQAAAGPAATAQPVHLVGNSFGGVVASEVASRRPDLVATLTLLAPAMPDLRPDVRRLSDPRAALAPLPWIGRRVRRELAKLTPHERALQLLRLCFAVPEDVPAHRVLEVAEEFRLRAALPWAARSLWRTSIALLHTWLRPPWRSLWRAWGAMPVPTLVVWGRDDRLISVRKAPRVARVLGAARLLVLPRTGHVPQMERPRLVARAMLGWWRHAVGPRTTE